jgi:MATE family multidrug resistance protein
MARAASPTESRLVASTGLALAGAAAVLIFSGIALSAGPIASGTMSASATVGFQVLLLVAASELFGPVGAASSGLLRGLKNTRPPMLFSLVGNWAIAAPVGVWLAVTGLGAVGVWIGLALGTAVSALLTLARLARHIRPALPDLPAARC